MLFADGHMHSNPVNGLGVERIYRKLEDLGVWFVALVSLPPHHYGFESTLDGYFKALEVFIGECRKAKATKIRTLCFAGLHPAEIDRMACRDKHKLQEVLTLVEKVYKAVESAIRRGDIDGIGEVGRPHYKTSPEGFVASEIAMRWALIKARDLGVPVHLHLEQAGAATATDIDEVLSLLHVDKNRVVLHHLDIATAREAQSRGLVFTVPGKYEALKAAFKTLRPYYMVESDFIDDPKRPGVSSYPWDAVNNQKKLLTEGVVDEEYLSKINIDTVVKVYAVEPP